MSFVDLVPVTANLSMTQGLRQKFKIGPVQTAAGVAVDMSAWDTISALCAPPAAVPYGTDTTFGTVTGDSSGYLYLTTAAADLASAAPGQAKVIIKGKKTSGDDFQLLASGTLSVNNA